MTATDDVIESLVQLTHGCSDQRTQHYYRQSLQVLVELAKAEQRQETNMGLPGEDRFICRGTMH